MNYAVVLTTFHWMIGGLVLLTIIGLMVIVWTRCPKCRRHLALKATGRVKPSGLRELVCKYCGYDLWRQSSDSTHSSPPSGG